MTLSTENGLPRIRAYLPLPLKGGEINEEWGEIPSFQALGVTVFPFPSDDAGHAEGVVLRDCAGRDGVIVGARDARCAKVVAKGKPGDAVFHAVDPKAKAQLRLQANRMATLMTKDSQQKTMMALLDGKNDRMQFAAFGGIWEMSPENGIVLSTPDGKASVQMKNGKMRVVGDVAVVPALCSLGTTELGVAAPGDPAALFAAVASLVDARFAALKTYIDGHIHSGVTTGAGNSGTPTAASPTAATVAATKVKVV